MKKYIISSEQGASGPKTEEEIIAQIKAGALVRTSQIAPYIGLGVSGGVASICSVPVFEKAIQERERPAELERQERDKLAEQQRQEVEKARQDRIAALNATLSNRIALLLAPQILRTVYVNYTTPDASDATRLEDVNDQTFTVRLESGQLLHIPLPQVLHVLEDHGVLFVRVVQLVIYKGATSIGVSIPIPH